MLGSVLELTRWVSVATLALVPREYAGPGEVRWPEQSTSVSDEVTRPPKEPNGTSTEPEASAPAEAAEPIEPRRRAELDFELSGLVGAVISHRTGGFTFGGPRFGFRVGHFSMGLSFYPSLLYSTYRDRHRIRPGLGFGFEIAYRGVTLFAPVYHVEDRYLPAFGIGYRFHLIRTVRRRQRDTDAPRRKRRRSRSRDTQRPAKQTATKP